MPKHKSMIITAIVLGCIGVLPAVFAAIVFLSGNSSVYADIGKYLGLSAGKLSTPLLCQLSVIFETAAFIFAAPVCDSRE